MIGWVIERIVLDLPTIAIGYAERDEAIIIQETFSGIEKRLRIFLVFENFEKRDHSVSFERMRLLKVGRHSSEYVAQAVVLLRETDSVLIGFDSGDVEARVASGREKISGAAAHIEQAAIFRRLGIV